MAGISLNRAPGAKGSVLEHEFGPAPQSYFSTSYPHEIMESREIRPRSKKYSNLPHSLMEMLRGLESDEIEDKHPRYVMNLTTFSPEERASQWNEANEQDDPSQLWFLYSWIKLDRGGPCCQWNTTDNHDLSPSSLECHPALGLRIQDFHKKDSNILSYVAFGPPQGAQPGCFFLRTTNVKGTWDYRWAGLPERCEMAVQRYIRGGERAARTEGRLRAVEFGYDGSWVVYSSKLPDDKKHGVKRYYYDWWLSPHYPKELGNALLEGQKKGWSINKVSLNTRNPKEYVLAFNEEAHLYAALHKRYMEKFKKVANEWAEGLVNKAPNAEYVELEDVDCHHLPPPPKPHHESNRQQTSLQNPLNRDTPASNVLGYIRRGPSLRNSQDSLEQPSAGPYPGMVELEGDIPPHYHRRPSAENTCSHCKAGYPADEFQERSDLADMGRVNTEDLERRRGIKVFGYLITRVTD